MDGAFGQYGAVCCVTETKNPIFTAKALAEGGPHRVLTGKMADDHTKSLGFENVPNQYFVTPFRREYWERKSAPRESDHENHFGTVGAIVLDSHGNLAAAGSTGGTPGKVRGRVGDTAILGAGLFADKKVAVVW